MRRALPLLVLFLLLGGWQTFSDGEAALEAGDFPTAVVQFRLALREAQQAGDPEAQAAAMVGLGRTHAELGRHKDAIDWFEQAIAIDRQAGNQQALGSDLVALGNELDQLGRVREAKKRYEQAFDSFQASGDPIGAADAIVNLALTEASEWRFDRAVELLLAAQELYRAAEEWGGLGDALTNLGIVLADIGQYGDAMDAQLAALEAYDAAHAPDGRGAALHNLGNLYAELGDYDAAVLVYRQSRELLSDPDDLVASDLAIAELLLAAGELDAAREVYAATAEIASPWDQPGILLNLGELDDLAGDPSGASASFEQAAALAREIGDEPTEAAALLGLGGLQLDRGQGDAAFATYKEATAVATRLKITELQWRGWYGLGLASRARGADGLAPLQNAVNFLEESRKGLEGLEPWAVQQFVADRAAVYEALIDALLASGNGASALMYAERLQVAEMGSGGGAGDPQEARYKALAEREVELATAIEQASRQPAEKRDGERIAALQEQLAQTRVEFSQYVDQLRTSYPDFDRIVRVDPTDIEAYQRDLGPDEVVLQPVVLPDRIAILVFSSGPLVFRETKVTKDELDARIGRVLRTMRKRRLSSPEKLEEHLDALGGWLWEPVAADIAGKKRVIVAASGSLRYLPFQILRRNDRYLVQDHEVVNVTNVGSLKRREGEGLRLGQAGLLALGNPDGTLPAADEEVNALAALFPGAATLHGAAATREALRANAGGRTVLHLATHGVLDSGAPERSYIVLADKKLGYLEIPGLYETLRDTGMVVLSACETAVPLAPEGDAVQGGGLEIAGLANQFRRAGVPRLLASLWQVSDESTRALMVRFYEALGEGRSPPAALAVAQRSLLADESMKHPFYWAPFILIGTPR